ncbi:AAA domain-containing protein [Desulfitobacterium chlororespirans]|uniref:Superfamily I DNA and/or RNA helicase n=1 Tax=Desulfitobacterium chlororespirans DSM 11544 TaxID=1121395 RepID=A0A1M7RX70_9FIRM|nr:AAA domain-containing protein [Desulfitobacterium chlororespirans]SHN50622.1 Superfamily I DNA and/or RNA helicase [Desulfitobacterium chlororespirans DSM 11544]
MNPNDYLICLKGEDKTEEVKDLKADGRKVKVTFKDNPFPYSYFRENVFIAKNPKTIDMEDKVAYSGNIPLYDVESILDFGPLVRVRFRNKSKGQVFSKKELSIKSNGIDKTGKDILEYWKEIAHFSPIDDEEESFLEKVFDKLTFVSPESVLSSYINKAPLQKHSPDLQSLIFPFPFNLEQKEALENALSCNITVIEGPPGTGKTQSILNILLNLITRNKTVAVVSDNNAAVKNVRDKLEEEGYGFLVAALGSNKNKEAFFNNMPQGNVQGWSCEIPEEELAAKITSLNTQINHLLKVNLRKAEIQQQLSAYLTEQEHFEAYYEKQDIPEIQKLSFYRTNPEKIIAFLADSYIANKRGTTDSFLYKIKLLFSYGLKDFKALQENDMDLVISLQRKFYQLKIESLIKQKAELAKELEHASFDQLLKQHKHLSEMLFKQKLAKKYHNKRPAQFTIKNYKAKFAEFIEHFPIVLSTTYSLRYSLPENYLLDYVIIDESSQVNLLTGVLALSCCKNAIIVGDTKQLPQIVDEKIISKLSKQAAEPVFNYFEHNILSSILSLYGELGIPKVMLKEHFRCHPKIIEFCNQKYYNGYLVPFTQEDMEQNPLILYRTAEGNHMRNVTTGAKPGKYNQREIDVIVQEILQNPSIAQDSEEIGFTTPYAKQVGAAGRMLPKEIQCDTIHKYQGREKKVMIMSTVLDDTKGGKSGLRFVDDPCKINVAVSRAIKQFVLVTDHSLFNRQGKEIGDLIRYIEYNTLDQNIIESEIVSVFDLLYKEYSAKLNSFSQRLTHRSRYKSQNIIYTLLDDILKEKQYDNLSFTTEVMVKNLLKTTERLTPQELRYVDNRASVDIVIFHKQNKQPVLIIEVDGFAFHENNPAQLEKDAIKDEIMRKYDFRLLRLPTNYSGEEGKIKRELDAALEAVQK